MHFEEILLGAKYEIEPVTIQRDDMMDFAKKYDSIPLHTDEEYAKTTMFGGLIAPGVMSFMSVWEKYLETVNLAGNELIAGKSTKIEWLKPVFAGDVLKSTCTVSNSVRRNARNGLIEISFDVFNQHGDLVLKDTTEMIVKCKPTN